MKVINRNEAVVSNLDTTIKRGNSFDVQSCDGSFESLPRIVNELNAKQTLHQREPCSPSVIH